MSEPDTRASNNRPRARQADLDPATPTEALSTAAKLVQDDIVLMVENDGEQPRLQKHHECSR